MLSRFTINTVQYARKMLAFSTMIAVLFATLAVLACGDAIIVDTTLTANLGPCVGNDGLIINANGVTLDLNGYSIIGSGILSCGPGLLYVWVPSGG